MSAESNISPKKYVIIGNSAAAVGCIEGIRSVDKEGTVTVVSNEPYHTYARPLISYLLCGKTDRERMKYRPDSFYTDNRCETLFGKTAVKILPDEKSVLLDDGAKIEYDRLLVATGSSPFVPPAEGFDSVENKYTFMKLDDALTLGEALKHSPRVLIIGAGLIGLKCAEGIYEKAGSVTVVDLAPRILSSILDDDGAEMVMKHLQQRGLKFVLGDSVAAYTKNSAQLKSGLKIDFDILVTAVGVRPNISLVKDAGGKVGRGISSDENCATSLPDIYAAGDCTESFDISFGAPRILALLPNAYMQGECAGVNMAGGSRRYDKAIPMNAIGFMGLHIITAGSYAGDKFICKDGGSYKALFTKDNRLCGYILIGDVARAGIYTSLIREQTPLDAIDYELIKLKPQLMAFASGDRMKMMNK